MRKEELYFRYNVQKGVSSESIQCLDEGRYIATPR